MLKYIYLIFFLFPQVYFLESYANLSEQFNIEKINKKYMAKSCQKKYVSAQVQMQGVKLFI